VNDDATGMPEGMKASVDRTMRGIATDSANALLLKRIPQCLTVFFAIPQISSSPQVCAESSAFRSLLV